LYAPYFCDDTTYAADNGGKWDMLSSNTNLTGCGAYNFKTPSPDVAEGFYTFLMG
jgi:hypothetical protein